jgi:hypothetical protein
VAPIGYVLESGGLEPNPNLTYGRPQVGLVPVEPISVWFAAYFLALTLPDGQGGELDIPVGAARFLPGSAAPGLAAVTRVFSSDGIAIVALSGIFPMLGAKQIDVPLDAVSHALTGAASVRRSGPVSLSFGRQIADNPEIVHSMSLEGVRFRGRGWTIDFREFGDGSILTATSSSGQVQEVPILINAQTRTVRLLTSDERAVVARGGIISTPIRVPAKPTPEPSPSIPAKPFIPIVPTATWPAKPAGPPTFPPKPGPPPMTATPAATPVGQGVATVVNQATGTAVPR